MKIILLIIFLTGLLTGQNVDFRFDSDSESQAKTVTSYSSFWLSRTPLFSPFGAKRLLVSAGYSAPFKRLDGETWILPDADLAVKVTNNLALSGKVYGFSTEKDQPQVVGAGIQYFFGNEEEKSWVVTVQRADLKGLYSFRIKSFTFDIRKWMPWSIILIRVGAGSNYYKESTHKATGLIPARMEGQTNYIAADAMLDIFGITGGLGLKFHPDRTFLSFFLQKGI